MIKISWARRLTLSLFLALAFPYQAFPLSIDQLNFTFVGLQQVQPNTFASPSTGTDVTINEGFVVPFGESLDLISRLTNLSAQSITIGVSNPPTAIPSNSADLILSGLFSQQNPLNAHFGGPVVVFNEQIVQSGFFGGNGSYLTLLPQQSIEFLWGQVLTANIVPDGDLSAVYWGVTHASITGGYVDSSGTFGPFLLDQPFAVTLTNVSQVPEPSALLLFGSSLVMFLALSKKRLSRLR